ncbi:hypothetical protein MASR1M107_31280 [Ignavibacteriales bacterium]
MKARTTLLILLTFSSILNAQWLWQNPLPQGNWLFDVKYTNPETAMAVGADGTIIKTTDGGGNWQRMEANTGYYLHGLFTLNSQISFAVGDHGTFLKTTDGGSYWEVTDAIVNKDLIDVFFINEMTGWATGWGV